MLIYIVVFQNVIWPLLYKSPLMSQSTAARAREEHAPPSIARWGVDAAAQAGRRKDLYIWRRCKGAAWRVYFTEESVLYPSGFSLCNLIQKKLFPHSGLFSEFPLFQKKPILSRTVFSDFALIQKKPFPHSGLFSEFPLFQKKPTPSRAVFSDFAQV